MSELYDEDDALRAFLEAMREGYASGTKPIPIKELPGSKMIPWKKGDWKVVDFWFTVRGRRTSEGRTHVYCNDTLWWTMEYGGWYKSTAIDFLRFSLNKAYAACNFFGGRGPNVVNKGPLVYTNIVESGSTFSKFSCAEQIVNIETGETLGNHSCRGGLLI